MGRIAGAVARNRLSRVEDQRPVEIAPDPHLQLGKLHPRDSIRHPLTPLILRVTRGQLNAEVLSGGRGTVTAAREMSRIGRVFDRAVRWQPTTF